MNQATGVKQQQDDELNDSGFLSHWLIWHMFVYYCLEVFISILKSEGEAIFP